MKAVRINQFGGPEVLMQEEVSVPQPKKGELLIEVHACGLNPVDYKLREGHLKDMLSFPFPHTLGGDISGVVQEVAPGVEGFKVGDEVYFSSRLNVGGGYAEFCTVEASLVAMKPKKISFVQAASLPVVGLTTLQCLRDYSGIQAGDKVLIHAGAGGLGSFAIQYAKHCKAEVFTTVSKKNTDYVRALGADHVIDYQSEDFVDVCLKAGSMDIVFETMGGLSYPKSILAVREGGSVPCVVNPPDADTLALAEKKGVKTSFVLLEGRPKDLNEIALLIDGGFIKPTVTQTLTLDQVRRGHEQIQSGRTQGKWVIQIRPN